MYFYSSNNGTQLLMEISMYFPFNPIALRKAKIAYNFGLSECNRANYFGLSECSRVNKIISNGDKYVFPY